MNLLPLLLVMSNTCIALLQQNRIKDVNTHTLHLSVMALKRMKLCRSLYPFYFDFHGHYFCCSSSTCIAWPKSSSKGEINICWIFDEIDCYATIDCNTNTTKLSLPHVVSQLCNCYNYSQDEDIIGVLADKTTMFYIFDTSCIQNVDSFQIHIDSLKIQQKHVHSLK